MLVRRIAAYAACHEHHATRIVRPLQLLLLSYIGVILHVLMDLLNNYGVRLLMPFSQLVLRRRALHHRSLAVARAWRRRLAGAAPPFAELAARVARSCAPCTCSR